MRIDGRPSEFALAWQAMRDASAALGGTLIHGSPGRGTARAIVPEPSAAVLGEALGALARHPRAFYAERLPEAVWAVADGVTAARRMPDDEAASRRVRGTLMRRIKDAYDPMHLLNPGILGEAIG